MNTLRVIWIVATALFIATSCTNKQEAMEVTSELIEITTQQFHTDSMHLGKIEPKVFESTIKCSGTILPMANGIAVVNAPLPGVVKSIRCRNGQYVQKNVILLEISGNEIIDIQKDFAEASAYHKRVKSEYERIKTLFNEKVTSEKDFITAETEYKTSLARYQGLKMKIEAMGYLPLKIENGEFYTYYLIRSPIRGYISGIKALIGSYIDSHSELMEIIDPSMSQIQLNVFASDIKKVRKGQLVRVRSVDGNMTALATLSSVGIAMNEENKSIGCIASYQENSSIHLIVNEVVESEIFINKDTVKALPTEAIIKTETGYYILALKKKEKDRFLFFKTEVKIGRQYNGYTEILNDIEDNTFITKGVYNSAIGI